MQKLSAIDSPKNRIFSLVLLVVILGGWEGLIKLLGIPPFILPPPSMVAFALWQGFASGLYFEHIAVTVFQTIAGFILGCGLGFLLGVAVALSRQTAYFMYPYIVMFENMPKVALAPLIVLCFGLGMTSKIITAGLIAFFPLLVNTNTGLNSVDKDRVDLIRSLGGSERQIFFMVRLPSALPFIFAGLEVAIGLALIGTVVAEFLGAERGLGMLMQSMNYMMDISGSFSILIILALIGLILNRILLFVRSHILFWEKLERGETASPGPEKPAAARMGGA
jgi:NitT/TauT family transport system permease protein